LSNLPGCDANAYSAKEHRFRPAFYLSHIKINPVTDRAPDASQLLFDAGPSLATCRVERRSRRAASFGPARTKQVMTKNGDAP
jgi:hypothetical protein